MGLAAQYSHVVNPLAKQARASGMSTPTATIRRGCLIVGAFIALMLAIAAPAQANGSPDLQLSGGPAPSVLFGHNYTVRLTTSLAPMQLGGFNVAYYALLPNGVHYVPGSSPEGNPRQVQVIDPANPGYAKTALQWDNTGDLVPNSTHTLTFDVSYNTTAYSGPERSFDVADTIAIDAEAYISPNTRDETDWHLLTGKGDGPASIANPDTFTGWASGGGSTTLSAIEVVKSEPSPEHELPRGVHDKQTVYTLTINNNSVNPTSGVSLEDFIPAGIEYLGCSGATDNTTNAPTNPSSVDPGHEYEGSGPIVVGPDGDHCDAPDSVETVGPVDPDGNGPLPTGIYTHLKWDSVPGFAVGESKTFTYAAAIPLRANTMTWPGGNAPDPTTGAQASNLDNNSGPETLDEQPLLNGAFVEGTYEPPSKPPKHVSNWGTALVIAEDIAIQKSNNNHGLEVGDFTLWTLDIQASEYRSLDDVVITDTVPDGLCPLDPPNDVEHTPPVSTTECEDMDLTHRPTEGPPAAGAPLAPYTSVAEQPGGAYTVVWDKNTVTSLAHIAPSKTRQIKFWTKTREYYQGEDFKNDKPVVSRDSVENAVQVSGNDWVRCTDTPNDCAAGGMKIEHDELPDGEPDLDVSGSSKTAGGVTIDKQVALPPITGSCATATYSNAVPEYGPGDKVCWKLRVDFPTRVHTRSQHVRDYLPDTVNFVSQGEIAPPNTIPPTAVTFTPGTPLDWALGTGGSSEDIVQLGPGVFEYYVETTGGSPLGHHSGDVEGNLMKFSYENTAGRAFALRDHADFKLKIPELSLLKGVAAITSPNGTDHERRPERGQQAGDGPRQRAVPARRHQQGHGGRELVADHRRAAAAASAARTLSPEASPTAALCIGSQIEWPDGPRGGRRDRDAHLRPEGPHGREPVHHIRQRRGRRRGDVRDQPQDGKYKLVPDNPTVRDPSLPAANDPAAEDASKIVVRCATVVKQRTTSASARPGTPGRRRRRSARRSTTSITPTIPEGTTMYGAPTVVDDLGARQALVAGTLTANLNGSTLPTAGCRRSATGPASSSTFPATYPNPAATTCSREVLGEASSTSTPTSAAPTSRTSRRSPTASSATSSRRAAARISTRIVEPNIAIVKSAHAAGTIAAGQTIDSTITVTNPAARTCLPPMTSSSSDLLPTRDAAGSHGPNNDIAGPRAATGSATTRRSHGTKRRRPPWSSWRRVPPSSCTTKW